ncbi:MAG: RNA polymerase sigma factor [Pirellulaceae bacterium]
MKRIAPSPVKRSGIGKDRVEITLMTTLNDSRFRDAVLEAAGRLQGKLIRYTSRFFGGDEEAAQDVVQHAFLQLCRTEGDKRPGKIDQWLYRVCRNRAIDLQRGRQRMQSSCQQLVCLHTDSSKSAFQQLSHAEICELVQERICHLPDSQSEAIDLWSHGLRYAQIAEIMDRAESSIRVLVHRGITKLRSDPAIRGWLSDEDEQSADLRDGSGTRQSSDTPHQKKTAAKC